jgi:hypothetical protein
MSNHSAAYIAKKLLKLFGPHGEHWTRGVLAKTKSGLETSTDSKDAAKFCMLGGLRKLGLPQSPIADKLSDLDYGDCIVNFNDGHYFPTVRRVLKQIAAGA